MAETKPVRVSEETHRELKSQASMRGLGLGEFTEIALKRFLAREKKKTAINP